MRMAVVNFQRPRDHAFFPQRITSIEWISASGGLHHCFNDDFSVVNRLSGGRTDGIVAVAIIVLPDANVSQHVVNIGDGDRIGVNITADDIANLT